MTHIHLMPDQQMALDGPEPARAVDPRNNATYVLVREETYERMKAMLADDAMLTTAEMVDDVMAKDDVGDPSLEFYQRKYQSLLRRK